MSASSVEYRRRTCWSFASPRNADQVTDLGASPDRPSPSCAPSRAGAAEEAGVEGASASPGGKGASPEANASSACDLLITTSAPEWQRSPNRYVLSTDPGNEDTRSSEISGICCQVARGPHAGS